MLLLEMLLDLIQIDFGFAFHEGQEKLYTMASVRNYTPRDG